jgi:hypothetical protein
MCARVPSDMDHAWSRPVDLFPHTITYTVTPQIELVRKLRFFSGSFRDGCQFSCSAKHMRKKTCIKVITVSKKTNIEIFYVIYYFWLPSRNTACKNEGGCVCGTFSCICPFPDPCASLGTLQEGAASVCPGTPPGMHANASPGTPIVGAWMADAAIDWSHKLKGSATEGGVRARGTAAAAAAAESGRWLRGMALAENVVRTEGMAAAESGMCTRGRDARTRGAAAAERCVCARGTDARAEGNGGSGKGLGWNGRACKGNSGGGRPRVCKGNSGMGRGCVH